MSAVLKFAKLAGIVVLCLSSMNVANAASDHNQRKAKKPVLPPLPSGPTGPVPQIPLDSIAPVPPQVSYENGLLTIVAANSTLGDILRAVRKQTGAEIEIPEAKERVVTHLGPAPARDVIAELLNGSRFNYVLLGSALDPTAITRVVLVAKGPDATGVNNQPPQAQLGMNQAVNVPPPQQAAEANDAEATDDNAASDDSDQPAEAEQPTNPPEQPEVKTPQQMLQEMQQRQLQLQQQQQQQQPGQPPNPGPVMPGGRPPQEQQ